MKKWKKSEQRLSESGKKLIQFVEACLLNSLQRSKGTYVSAFLLLRIFFHWGGGELFAMETKEMMKIKIELGEKERDSKACQLQIFLNVFMR